MIFSSQNFKRLFASREYYRSKAEKSQWPAF